MSRLPSILINQPVKLTVEQLRSAINESIFEGGCVITISEPKDGKKSLSIAWGNSGDLYFKADVPEDFEIIPESKQAGLDDHG